MMRAIAAFTAVVCVLATGACASSSPPADGGSGKDSGALDSRSKDSGAQDSGSGKDAGADSGSAQDSGIKDAASG